jgi:hypothetical protein
MSGLQSTLSELLHHNLELCSKSFTLGNAQASLALLSLNHDFAAIDDVQALLGFEDVLSIHVVDDSFLSIL